MKKGYYVHSHGRDTFGVSKKIDMQLDEFRRFYEMEELEIKVVPRSLIQRVLGLFPTASIARDYDSVLAKMENPDFIYARRNVCDRKYLHFWKEVKKRFPDCKVIVEIFTYPYDKDDFGKWNAWPFLIKEWIYRPFLKRYLDQFVIYTEDAEVFGIPTIRTTNGIIVDRVRLLQGERILGKIRMIGVAYMQRQHGYERIIKGLADYYAGQDKPYDIELMLVGDGPEKAFYQKLVQENGLSDQVSFYGNTTGDALDDLYDQADISLAIFGQYKLGHFGSTGAIKTRECLAKGIPMLSGARITAVEDDYPYLQLVPNDDSTVSMWDVIALHERTLQSGLSRQELALQIREYARAHVAMDVVMKPIIDYIEA